jgi:L-lactate dehydrogenase complex protein LldG
VSRDVTLGRIRAALASAPAPDGAGSNHAPLLPAPQTFSDPVGLFVERARQVGARVHLVATMADAADRAVSTCAERAVRRAAAWTSPDLAPIVEALREAGIETLARGAPAADLATAEAGVTGAAWGIAETGTLVLPADADRPRLASLLPPLHIAVLRADHILPDLPALFARAGDLPSALTFITGPSRTADIGLTLVLGAHGPMDVTILIIEARTSTTAA